MLFEDVLDVLGTKNNNVQTEKQNQNETEQIQMHADD